MPRVLIVDDEPDLRFLVRMLLEARGVEVDEAPNGRAALDRIATIMPDVVVTDLAMPVMGGRELITRLRADDATSGVRILVWSEHPDRKLAVDDVVAKPYAGEALLERVLALAGATT